MSFKKPPITRIPSVEIRRVSWQRIHQNSIFSTPVHNICLACTLYHCTMLGRFENGWKVKQMWFIFWWTVLSTENALVSPNHFCFPIRLLQTDCLQSKVCSKYALNWNSTGSVISLQHAFVLCTPSCAALLHFVASEVEDIVAADCCDQLRPTHAYLLRI
jgi:hypothetical protein